ncbi:hypothetical protein [Brucella pituitosa]|uniref:hypothetical protein n=1 Tax=Brucella pituitosa TaxID=571256 RepID=UPI0009A2464A|nr:hypothetical protein [Brucella pituitosa]
MHSTLEMTGNDLANSLSEVVRTVNRPRFLHEILSIKRDRGDVDCDYFVLCARMFWARLNATVEGAYYTASRTKSMRRFAKMLEEFTHA